MGHCAEMTVPEVLAVVVGRDVIDVDLVTLLQADKCDQSETKSPQRRCSNEEACCDLKAASRLLRSVLPFGLSAPHIRSSKPANTHGLPWFGCLPPATRWLC